MKSKTLPLLAFVALLAVFILNSCGNSEANCPVCGTDKNGTIGLIDVMLVPEHNPNGEPGGPFNIFDISWVDPVNRNYVVSDRIGLDVPVFNTVSNIALWAIGGDIPSPRREITRAHAGSIPRSVCQMVRLQQFLPSQRRRVTSRGSDAKRTDFAYPGSSGPTVTSVVS